MFQSGGATEIAQGFVNAVIMIYGNLSFVERSRMVFCLIIKYFQEVAAGLASVIM